VAPAAPIAQTRAAPVSPAPKATTELNALAIGWALVKSWFAGLFGKRA